MQSAEVRQERLAAVNPLAGEVEQERIGDVHDIHVCDHRLGEYDRRADPRDRLN